ncbi:MAG: hypothetical protein HKO59_02525 [Phycisphaerales bacterium]|nr:hypothetical protein [Phycisphaerae bacterium]NNF41792.1 hypothetical protein [Phycisphaerales bacterium]NNM24857.1 hypothetical protein [Phycisphaerales bacterium]
MTAPLTPPTERPDERGETPRRSLRPNVGTTIATYALLALAGSVSFILPDSIDAPVSHAVPRPPPRPETPVDATSRGVPDSDHGPACRTAVAQRDPRRP